MPKLKLRKFDPSTIKDDRIVALMAPRGSGKSTCLSCLMYYKRHLPLGVVFSATEEGNHFFREICPDSFIYNSFSEEAVERVMARQKKKVTEYQQIGGSPPPNAFIIADDCMADKKLWRSLTLRDLFLNGRHRKAFMIFTMQYCMDITPDLRTNIDYVFALMDDSIPNKERMYKQFFGCFPNYDTFSQVFDMVTNDFGVLVLDKTIKSNKLEDKVFWFKADIMPKYRLGCAQFWEYDRLRNKAYAEQPPEKEEEDVLQQYHKGRTTNKPRITVVKDF